MPITHSTRALDIRADAAGDDIAGQAKRRPPWAGPAAAAALFLLTLAAHAPAIPGKFLWDDDYWIERNPVLLAGQAPWGYWCSTEMLDYLPVTSTFFYLQRQLWGQESALPYRAVNVVLHALAAVVIWRVLAALGLGGAWLGAALFAVHPVTVASVGWVSESKNTLSMIFYGLALLAYLRFDARGRWISYAAAVAAFALALLAKTSTVVLPAVLVAILWWRRRPLRDLRSLAALGGLFLLAAAASVVAVRFHRNEIGSVDVGPPHGALERLMTAARAVWFYLFKAVAPANLMMIYPKWDPARLGWTALAGPGLLAWAAGMILLRRRAWVRPAAAATGCFVLSLAPVLGFVDMAFMRFSFVSDHLAYLALPVVTATAPAVAWRLARRGGRWRAGVTAAAAAAIVLLAAATACRAHLFADSSRLWSDTVRRNPGSFMGHYSLGYALARQASAAAARNDDSQHALNEKAVEHLLTALRLKGDFTDTRVKLGVAYANLARGRFRQGNLREAARCGAEAVGCDPNNADFRHDLGRTLYRLNRPQEALEHLELALASRPDWPEADFSTGQVLVKLGRHAEAMARHRHAVSVRPDFAPSLIDLAWLLATAQDDALRDAAEALELAQRAASQRAADPFWLHMSLAAAHAELGHAQEAAAAAQRALDAAGAQGRRGEVPKLQALIEYYARGQTFRDFNRDRP